MIFNLRFGAVPTWRPPSEVTDDTDDITREAKRRRLSQMLTSNMRREYEQTSSNCAGWELADRRAAFEWLVPLPNGLSSIGHGGSYQHTADDLLNLVNCEDTCEHLADQTSVQKSASENHQTKHNNHRLTTLTNQEEPS